MSDEIKKVEQVTSGELADDELDEVAGGGVLDTVLHFATGGNPIAGYAYTAATEGLEGLGQKMGDDAKRAIDFLTPG